MTTWFTADQHWGHSAIIGYTNRPFADVNEMDGRLVDSWNSRVNPDDTVYHLGDFCLGGVPQARAYFKMLNGKITVLDNQWHHDCRWITNSLAMYSNRRHSVDLCPPLLVIEYPEYAAQFAIKEPWPWGLSLCHYPLAEWERKHYRWGHVHGHSHGQSPTVPLRLDVGVDNAYKLLGSYCPFSLAEVAEIMGQQYFAQS